MQNQNLEEILNKDNARIYFVGIGGIAMSAAASIAKSWGYSVSGSDSKELYEPAKNILESNKIIYFKGYEAKNAAYAAANLYVLSAGEGLQNPEVKYILENNLPRTSFPELLYQLAKNSLRIVVAGTHGKSTTAGLLGHLAKNLDNSSFFVGGVLQNYGSNFYKGGGNYFVFEGDEYKSQFDDATPKFIYYKPDVLLLTNLEYDHPDLFPNFEELRREFAVLIANMPEDGLIAYNADDPELVKLVHETNVASVSFGVENLADFQATAIEYGSDYTSFSVENKFSKNSIAKLFGESERYKIQLPGKLNVYNSLAAIAVLRALGFAQHQLAIDLLSFKGIKRRFEIVSEKKGIIVIDDYAHHPTAVKQTLEAAKLKYFSGQSKRNPPEDEGKNAPSIPLPRNTAGKLWAVFEPHTFSRTKATLPELAVAFDSADKVLISEIYPARESAKDAGITSDEVVEAIKSEIGNRQSAIRKVRNKAEALGILKNELKPNDVVVIMAVGAFNRLAYELKEIL